MKTLHLVLTGHWYDKIASGEKTSEYRACTPYWNKRLVTNMHISCDEYAKWRKCRWDFTIFCKYDHVCFHRGYTAETMLFPIRALYITTKPNDLNLDHCWEIKLGKRIK